MPLEILAKNLKGGDYFLYKDNLYICIGIAGKMGEEGKIIGDAIMDSSDDVELHPYTEVLKVDYAAPVCESNWIVEDIRIIEGE